MIYLAIALAGLIMVCCFAVWLWRRAVALLGEAGVLLERVDELAGLLEQIGQPVEPNHLQRVHGIVDEDDREGSDLAKGSTPRQAT
jgi:hypothetical protein